MTIDKIAVCGLGLIGGSLSKSFHESGKTLYGFDIDRNSLAYAASSGIFTGLTDDISELMDFGCDLIYICLPVSACTQLLGELKERNVKTPVTDAASTKRSVMKAASGLNFCGGHPIAGMEVSGFENSTSDLFRGAFHMLCPQAEEFPVEELRKLHLDIGMKVMLMDADRHDRTFGAISHLPHVTAFALVEAVEKIDKEAFSYTGGGFRDFTRIAASNPKMWTDIFTDNKDNMAELIDVYIDMLKLWREQIVSGDTENVSGRIEKARNIRRSL